VRQTGFDSGCNFDPLLHGFGFGFGFESGCN
jgi:hypothetical protein